MSVTGDAKDTVGTWATKLVSYIASLALLGLLVWLVTTTKSNSDVLIKLAAEKVGESQLQRERETRYTDKMESVAKQLSEVANNLKDFSSEMYPRSEAEKRFTQVESDVQTLKAKTSDLSYQIKYAGSTN